jgi:hypothetical protein
MPGVFRRTKESKYSPAGESETKRQFVQEGVFTPVSLEERIEPGVRAEFIIGRKYYCTTILRKDWRL